MPLFRAEVYTSDAKRKILRREAANENELLRELSAENCTVVSVREEKMRTRSFLGSFIGRGNRKKLSLEEQRLFCTTLS